MKLILASSSRDRKQCFDLAHIPVEVIPSNFDEDTIDEHDPYQLVQRLALEKARVVQKLWEDERLETDGDALIIGADTMVVYEGELIGKAKDPDHAFQILSSLIGKTHEIITGVAIIATETQEAKTFIDSSTVHFQDLSPEEIWDYINVTNEYAGRAGAYSLFERAALFIDKLEGSPSNVLGIPMAAVREALKSFGINLLHPNEDY